MNRAFLIIIIITLSWYSRSLAQNNSNITSLTPDDMTLNFEKRGDISLDGIPDLILVFNLNDTSIYNKPVLVFFGLEDGSFELVGRNDKLAYSNFSNIAITRNYFTIENRVGTNATYSNYNHTFKVVDNKILFHRYDDATYEVLDWKKGPELNGMITTRAKDLGFPTFEGYKK